MSPSPRVDVIILVECYKVMAGVQMTHNSHYFLSGSLEEDEAWRDFGRVFAVYFLVINPLVK